MADKKPENVRAFEPETFAVSVIISILSAIICMQIIARIGTTPNTSVIGALMAMAIARIPLKSMAKFRSLDRQNLVQTMNSGAGFAAANCGLLAVGVVFAFGDMSLIYPMLIGSAVATLLGMHFVYRIFDSELFPADAAWAPGVATAQALIAGDEGGAKGKTLLGGILIGVAGAACKIKPVLAGGIPMAGIGIAFIANPFAMGALAVGLLIRGYYPAIAPALVDMGFSSLPLDLGKTYIPHGFMIGAGFVSLVQALVTIFKKKSPEKSAAKSDDEYIPSVSNESMRKAIVTHTVLFALAAAAIAVVSGIWISMPVSKLVLWVFWCTISSVIAPVLVGLCAMYSGWFPGFAITVIFLSLGLFMGFPAPALAIMTGFIASTGPCFADMGFDLKTGWIIRGKGKDLAYELDGRKQQIYLELVGGLLAMGVVAALMNMHFKQDLIPPVSRVFAATITAGSHPEILREMAMWAIPGAILQILGGSKKALGILCATGLLIKNPIYGVGLVIALIIRKIYYKTHKDAMELYGAGFVAGDGIYGFIFAIGRSFGMW